MFFNQFKINYKWVVDYYKICEHIHINYNKYICIEGVTLNKVYFILHFYIVLFFCSYTIKHQYKFKFLCFDVMIIYTKQRFALKFNICSM